MQLVDLEALGHEGEGVSPEGFAGREQISHGRGAAEIGDEREEGEGEEGGLLGICKKD